MLKKKKIVISGANITSGGPLTIFNSALQDLSQIANCEIIAIVNNSKPFYKHVNIRFIEIPTYKKIILLKFYYEYVHYKKLSKNLGPDVWISLNDFTPNVSVKNLYTYFHNASIFFKIRLSDVLFSNSVIFQKVYYALFLRFNLKKNRRFIVQQNWIGKSIHKRYHLALNQILLFKPNQFFDQASLPLVESDINYSSENKVILFYPTKATGYKNNEFVCEALKRVKSECPNADIELRITINGNENLYAKYLKKKYCDLPIVWLGSISRHDVEANYLEASVLVFPSRLETWGLPLTEFTKYGKPIFAIDLEYVHETLLGYPNFALFKANDINSLVDLLKTVIERKKIDYHVTVNRTNGFQSISTWKELLDL